MSTGSRDTTDARFPWGLVVILFWVLASWSLWCWGMIHWPRLAEPSVRAWARVLIVLAPSIGYACLVSEVAFEDFFLLRENWRRGVRVGLSLALVHTLLVVAAASSLGRLQPRLPSDFASWLNSIVGSPFAEELLFRGVVLRKTMVLLGASKAIAISAVAFAMLHLPGWWLSGELVGLELAVDFGMTALFGVIFGVVVVATRSLWASVIPHWGNNFAAIALGV